MACIRGMFVAAILALALGTTLGERKSYPRDHALYSERVINGNSEYEFFPNARETWGNSRFNCVNLGNGFKLVSIETAEEDQWIIDYINTNLGGGRNNNYWTSGTLQSVTQVWIWEATAQEFTYTNWHDGEPNNLGSEQWMELNFNSGYAWNNAPQATNNRYVCERPV